MLYLETPFGFWKAIDSPSEAMIQIAEGQGRQLTKSKWYPYETGREQACKVLRCG